MEKKTDDIIFYGNLNDKNIQGYAYSVYGVNRISPTLTANSGGGHMPYILEEDDECFNYDREKKKRSVCK